MKRPLRELLAPGAVLLLAAALRFAALGRYELWLDENYSVVMAFAEGGILRGALVDTNPPLYLYLLRGWMELFGITAGAVRSLSAVLGVAQLAVLGLWLHGFGLSRRAVGWALLLGALAPLHVYYSQEARAYTLLYLLATLALWSFTRAARTGRRRDWLAHGALIVAALYTHNIFLFAVPAFWAGAAILGFDRRQGRRLALAHAVAALLYLPWLLATLRVQEQGALTWLAEGWAEANPLLLLPDSIQALAVGARLPQFVRMARVPTALAVLGFLWMIAVLVAAGLVGARRTAMETGREDRRRVLFLAAGTLIPLLLLLLYSLAIEPIYVVGRYDTLVYPALLGVLGVGCARLAGRPARRGGGIAVSIGLLMVPLGITGLCVGLRLLPLAENQPHQPQQARGKVLKDYVRPGDLIVCLGLEGAKILYQMRRHAIPGTLLTYPLATHNHLGYFDPEGAATDPDLLARDAEAILEAFRAGDGAEEAPGRRLFLVLDPYAFRAPTPGGREAAYTRIAETLIDALTAAGLESWQDGEFWRLTQGLGLRAYTE